MQNDPFNDVPTGIDYLNQIAAPPPKAGFDRKSTIIIAIMAVIGVLSLLFIFIATQNSNPAPSLKNLAAKLQKMQTVTDKYNPKLRSSQLQQASSSLQAVLQTANASINEPLSSQGIDPKKQAKEITALDSPDKLDEKLSEAHLNAQLDISYAHEMNIEITEVTTMIERLQKSSGNSAVTEKFLAKALSDLTNIKKQLLKFIDKK